MIQTTLDIKELKEKSRIVGIKRGTRRLLREIVHEIAVNYFDGNHWKVWTPLKNRHGGINSYEELTEDEGQEEIRYLKRRYS